MPIVKGTGIAEPGFESPYRRGVSGEWEVSYDKGVTWAPAPPAVQTILAPYSTSVVQRDGNILFSSAGDAPSLLLTDIWRILALQRSASGLDLNAEETARALGYDGVDWPPQKKPKLVRNPDYEPAIPSSPGFPGAPAVGEEFYEDPNFEPGPDLDAMNLYTSTARSQAIPGAPGVTAPREAGGQDEQYVPGEAYGLPPGSLVKVDNVGKLSGYIAAPDVMQSAPDVPGAIVPGESIGGPPGTWFIRQPNGNLTPYTPPEADSTGDFMTAVQAANYIGERAETPEEFSRWFDALTGRGRATAPVQPAPIPTENLGEFARALSVDAEGNALQFRDAQGNPIQNPFAAAMLARPFPGVPAGAGGPTTPGISAFNPAAVLAAFQGQPATRQGGFPQPALATPEQATAAGQGPFTRATGAEFFDPGFAEGSPEVQADIQAEFGRRQQTTQEQLGGARFADAIQADLQALTAKQERDFQTALQQPPTANIGDALRRAQGGDVAGARADAQELVQRGFTARTEQPPQEGLTGQAARESPGFTDSLRRREAQLRGTGPSGQPLLSAQGDNAPPGQRATPGPAGQIPPPAFQAAVTQPTGFEPPFDISDLPPETQAAIRAGTAGVSQSGPEGQTTTFQAGVGGQIIPEPIPEPSSFGAPKPQDPFTRALAEITQRQQQQTKQRRFQATPIPRTVFR